MFNQNASEPTGTWTNITSTNTISNISHTVNANGRYYFWVKDAYGNKEKTYVDVENIGIKKTKNVTLTQEDSEIAYNTTLSGLYKVLSVEPNNGTISNINVSEETLSFTASNGSSKTGTRDKSCTGTPTVTSATRGDCKNYTCSSRRLGEINSYPGAIYPQSLSSTGTLIGDKCYISRPRGDSYSDSTHFPVRYTCSNGRWSSNGGNSSSSCIEGYYRGTNESGANYWSCNLTISQTCSTGESQYYYCMFRCDWGGNDIVYNASCSSYDYTCSPDSTKVNTTCYKCSSGTFNSTTQQCDNATCQISYTYYEYNVTITYVENVS